MSVVYALPSPAQAVSASPRGEAARGRFLPLGSLATGPVPPDVLRALRQSMSAVRAWRQHRGLGLDDLAGRIGVSAATLVIIEASAHLRRPTSEKLAAALGIPPALLVASHRLMARLPGFWRA